MAKVTSGQLNNSNLTMGDIKKACDSFCTTLRSMMHARIDYPKDDEGGKKKNKESEASNGKKTQALKVVSKESNRPKESA